MSRYFHDWEFLEDGRTIRPISVGIISEDGHEYYAVFADMPVEGIASHPWLMANVVPHLPQLSPPVDFSLPSVGTSRARRLAHDMNIDLHHPDVKPLHVIAAEVREFLRAGGGPVELWGYYSSYDHILLCQLWGRMVDLPAGIPMLTLDVQQEALRLGLENSLPRQVGGEHHALADARWTRDAWAYLVAKSSGRMAQ